MDSNSVSHSFTRSLATGYILFILAAFVFTDEILSQVANHYPGYGEAMALRHEYNYKQAIPWIDTAIYYATLNQDHDNILFYRIEQAELFRQIGRFDSAMAILLELKPDFMNPHIHEKILEAKFYLELGANLLNTGDLESGKTYLDKSLEIYSSRLGVEDTLLAPCYNKLGSYYFFHKQYSAALKLYQKAYELILRKHDNRWDIPAYLVNLGICNSALGNYKQAEDLLHRSLEEITKHDVSDYYLLFKVYNNLGKFYYDLSIYEQALYYYNNAEECVLKNFDGNLIELGILYWNKSILLRNYGDLHKAMLYIEKAYHIININISKESPLLPYLYMDKALIYSSLHVYNEAMKFYIMSLNQASLELKIKTYRNIASLYIDQLQFKKAKEFYDSCFSILRSNANKYMLEKAYTDLYYANFLNITGNTEALPFLGNAYKILVESFGPRHRDVAMVHNLRGEHFMLVHNPDSAIFYYHQALIALMPSFNDPDILSNPEESKILTDPYSIQILSDKADALMLRYRENNDFRYLSSLLQAYNLIILTIEEFKRLYRTEDGQQLMSESFNGMYKKSLEANLIAYETTGEFSYLEKAFEMSEKSKAAILLAELKDENAIRMGLIPDNMYLLEKSLRSSLYMFKTRIVEEEYKPDPDQKKLSYIRANLFSYEKRYDSLINEYERRYPEYFALKYDPSVIQLEKLQGSLKEGEVLLEYSVTDDHLILFIISEDEISYRKSNLNPNLARNISALRHNLYPPHAPSYDLQDYMQFQNLSYSLYCELIRPAEQYLQSNHVIIIPDQELAYLSFESLTDSIIAFDTLNFVDLPYLIKQYSFTYSSSATIYAMGSQLKVPELTKGILAMAPSYPLLKRSIVAKYGNIGGLADANRNLPGAAWEAEAILQYFPGDLISEENATEARFKSEAGHYDILHFAMHTYIDDKNPLSSKLSFYPMGEPPEDDVLQTYEIYGLPLKGHLAVLSACSTGDGIIQQGEGVISLARAFSYAGIPSVVMTLWDVEDISSGRIIPDFYRLLSIGLRKDEALRQSKLFYLNRSVVPIEAHPAFWAGYVLYGNNKPLMQDQRGNYISLAIALGAMMIIISAILIRRYIIFKRTNHIQLTDFDIPNKFQLEDRI